MQLSQCIENMAVKVVLDFCYFLELVTEKNLIVFIIFRYYIILGVLFPQGRPYCIHFVSCVELVTK